MSRKIEIHRLHTLHNLAQDDPEVKAWVGLSYRAIGPCWDTLAKSNISGLSFKEEKLIMPSIIKVEPTDNSFRDAVRRYFDEIVTSVPATGVTLEIGLQNDELELGEKLEPGGENVNLPLKPKDYVAYRHALLHPDVALNKDAGESTFGKKYYIHDPKGTSDSAFKLNKLEDDATAIYFKFKGDVVKIDQILVMLGVKIARLDHEQKILKFKELSQRGAGIESEQTDRLNRFIKTSLDKDLEYKYLITELIGSQFLKRVGQNIVWAETAEKIGDDLDDAVLYFKNPKNSADANILRAKYTELVKKGIEYLPKDVA